MVKWEELFEDEIDIQQWKIINNIRFKCTTDVKLRWFQYRVINRILGTNSLVNKFNSNETDRCTFCSQNKEDISHLFYQCVIVKDLWNDFKPWFHKKNCT